MPKPHLYKPSTTEFKDIEAKIYVQDPAVAAGTGGLTTIRLPGEPFLGPGPTTSRVEVVDENLEAMRLWSPVAPLSRGGGFAVGGGSPVGNFKHHQVNAWAIVTRTLNILEDPSLFGRRIPWAFPGGRLRVRPHAGVEDNAYYDRETGSLNFFHFEGRNGTVYTCLSHDIVAHELGHAVLDGMKPCYYEFDSPDVAGFHEYFGDAIAMMSSLTLREVVKEVVRAHPRHLSARNLVSDIALEFGSAGGEHRPLRSAANRVRMRDLRGNWEEHDYSEVLTGAFYDLLCLLYADAMKRAREPGKRRRPPRQEAVAALFGAANRTSRMMLRAVDYCPPAGLTYADYAQAVLRADEVAYPVDDRGYRRMAGRVLVRRGVLPARRAEDVGPPFANDRLREYDVDRLAATPTDAYVFVDANREALGIPRDVNFRVWSLYRTRKVSAGRYYPPREIVIEFGWTHVVPLEGRGFGNLKGEALPLWCGGALTFDTDGNVLHHTIKRATPGRIRRLREYMRYLVREGLLELRFSLVREKGITRLARKAALRHAARRA